jgi:thiol:disulfide interchange protein
MRFLPGILAAVLACSTAAAQVPSDKPFDPARDPAQDLKAAEQIAQREHKHILLDAGGNWCGWCKVLDRSVHADAATTALLEKNFVVLHVNWSPENHNDAFFSHYPPVNGYPFFFILDAKGKLLKAQSTDAFETDHKLANGYDLARLRNFLQQWSPTGAA